MSLQVQIFNEALPVKGNFSKAQFNALASFLANHDSVHTQQAYYFDLKHFFNFILIEDFSLITKEHIITYKNQLKNSHAIATITRRLACLRSFFNYLDSLNLLGTQGNPMRFVKIPSLSNEGKTPGCSDDQVRKMLEIAKEHRFRDFVILELLFYLGLRSSSLINLKIKNIVQEEGIEAIQYLGKGNKLNTVPLQSFISADINEYIKNSIRDFTNPETLLFVSISNKDRTKKNQNPLCRSSIRDLVKKYANLAGINNPKFTTHSARVVVCNQAIEKKETDTSIMAFLGWSSPNMVNRYTRRRKLRNSSAFSIKY